MKTISKILIFVSMSLALSGCDDFLTKEPETNLSPNTFFSSEAELELWTNRFYSLFAGPDTDAIQVSDIQIAKNLSSVQQGTRSPATENWGTSAWAYLRYINYYLERSGNCPDETIRQRYDGVAYFFRALFYFEKVRKYGDIPYYDFVIPSNDWASLKRPRDSRGFVMKKVMEDLDRAITDLPDNWPSDALYRLSKNAARAMKARAALYEGTFRKYHGIADETIDGVTISADYFLQLAADAAWAVMEQNKYSLYKGNTLKLDAPYREYFILEDGDAKETILSMRFNADILVRHGIQFTFRNMRHSATQRLVNHYLMADGSKIQDQPGYETMTYNQQFQNRDPRMAQTLMAPGYVDLNGIDEVIEDCKSYDMTGYRFIKFVSDDTHNGATTSTTDWPVFRYPEILLTYAEAKAELGTLTPEDIALTVDVVRDRVGMPALDMTAANNNPDPLMASYYPNVNSGANKGVILEIRRERTVELPCEGLRQWDMLRWKEGAQLVPSSNGLDGFLGCYFPSLGEYDMNGDGKMDLCLWSGTKPATTCDAMLEIGEGKDAQLTEGTSGYIVCFRGRTYKWDSDRPARGHGRRTEPESGLRRRTELLTPLCSATQRRGIPVTGIPLLRKNRLTKTIKTMKKLLLLLFAAALSLSASEPARAWGREGHETIAKIAERNLTKRAKKRIEKYLGGHSVVYYAKWMDEYRQTPEYAFTNDWHTAPVGADLRYGDELLKPGKGNAVYGLELAIRNLRDYRNLTDSAVAVNLKYVIHLVGDMHCPAHIKYTTHNTKYDVLFEDKYHKPHKYYVHHVWDNEIITTTRIWSVTEWAGELDRASKREKAAVQTGTPRDWLHDSAVTCEVQFEWAKPDERLGQDFLNKALPLVEHQIRNAGYRLAAVLNELFD